jgi:hypothetical protein
LLVVVQVVLMLLVELAHGIQLVDQAEDMEQHMKVPPEVLVDQAVAELAVATQAKEECLVIQEHILHPRETQEALEVDTESLDTPAAVAEPTNPVTLQPL